MVTKLDTSGFPLGKLVSPTQEHKHRANEIDFYKLYNLFRSRKINKVLTFLTFQSQKSTLPNEVCWMCRRLIETY